LKRCPPCNQSRHYQCRHKGCECKCQEYEDTVKNRAEPDRLSDPANDELIAQINKEYLELHGVEDGKK